MPKPVAGLPVALIPGWVGRLARYDVGETVGPDYAREEFALMAEDTVADFAIDGSGAVAIRTRQSRF
jgi:hypothetical protein